MVSRGDGLYRSSTDNAEPQVVTVAVSYDLNSFRVDPNMRAGEDSDIPAGPDR